MSKGVNQLKLIDWLNNNGSIEPLLNKVLFLNTGTEIINIRIGLKSLNKLLAVLPKRINQ
jgi:hypothetical protein